MDLFEYAETYTITIKDHNQAMKVWTENLLLLPASAPLLWKRL